MLSEICLTYGLLCCKLRRMRRIASAIFVSFLLLAFSLSSSQTGSDSPLFKVHRPTVIAFSRPVSDSDMDKDADLNEVLSDFQLYARQVRQPLEQAGIDFHEVYAHSFRIRVNGKTIKVRVGNKVGYYFAIPGKNPVVQYGVDTADDIVATALKYFGVPSVDR